MALLCNFYWDRTGPLFFFIIIVLKERMMKKMEGYIHSNKKTGARG